MVKDSKKNVESKNKDSDKEDLRRMFEFVVDGENTNFYLEMPSSEQIRQAEWHYSKVYNKALTEGVTTTSEMMDILTKRGLYGPEYEKHLQGLQVSISLKIAEMHVADGVDKQALALVVQSLRDDLYRWNQRLTGPLSNTCEQMADDAKTEFLTSAVVHDEAGEGLWATYDDFISEENQSLALKARFEVLLWLQGLDSDFLDKTPEKKVLKELAEEKEKVEATPLLETKKDTVKKVSKPKTRKTAK